MTSKEALKKLRYNYFETNNDDETEFQDLCATIDKEILKKYLLYLSNCEDEEPNEHIEACSGEGTDSWGYNKFSNWNINCVSDFRIVKEWLK